MIYYDYKRGLNEMDSHENLQVAFGRCAPSRSTIFNWFKEFKRGRLNLKDAPRSGRPKTASIDENVLVVRDLINEDRRITCRSIQNILNIGSASLNFILHYKLNVRKVACRWVQHFLTEDQIKARVEWSKMMLEKYDFGKSKKVYEIVTGDETWVYQFDPETKRQSCQWLFKNEQPPTKVKKSRSLGKKMVASFFRKSGHIATIQLEDRKTVNADWYCKVCLPEVLSNVRQKVRTKRHSSSPRQCVSALL